MSAELTPELTQQDLERRLKQAELAVLLVPPRILRRVSKRDRELTGPGLQVPHRQSYVIGREALLSVANRGELGLAQDQALPETVVLLPLPERARLEGRPREEMLLGYWR